MKFVIVLVVLAIVGFAAFQILATRRRTTEIEARYKLRSIVIGFRSYQQENGRFPSRSITREDGTTVSWRGFLIVEAAPEYRPDQRNPIYCNSGNRTNCLAIDYPGSPWGVNDYAGDLSALVLLLVDTATIAWSDAGDVVLEKDVSYPNDIGQDTFTMLPEKRFLVGRLDGTADWMTKEEIVSSVRNRSKVKWVETGGGIQ
jgi:hypothetical protein